MFARAGLDVQVDKASSGAAVATAVIVAAILRPGLLGAGPLFPYAEVPRIPWWGLGACALASLVAGLQSALMTKCLYGVEDLFRRLPIHWMWWPALGGLIVGIGGYLDPSVLGVGYDTIRALLDGGLDGRAAALLLAQIAATASFAVPFV